MRLTLSIILVSLYLGGCSALKPQSSIPRGDLTKFAYANCLMWYFESKGYDTEDIRSISGGIVEASDISLEKFQEIALAVKSYSPDLETKNNIDLNLLKCFHLEDSEQLSKHLE